MSLTSKFTGYTSAVSCCIGSLDGASVASGTEVGQVCVHDTQTEQLIASLTLSSSEAGDEAVTCLATSPSAGSSCLYASASTSVHVIDVRAGLTPVSTFQDCCRDEINQVAVNSKGTFLATADDSGDILVFDLPAGKQYKAMKGAHSSLASCVSFRPHRPWELLTGGMDCTVARWDFSRGKCLTRWAMSQAAAAGQEENQLFNPPFVHAMALPEVPSSCRPWCQLAAVARGDGGVLTFNADEDALPAHLTSSDQEEQGEDSDASGSKTGLAGKGKAVRKDSKTKADRNGLKQAVGGDGAAAQGWVGAKLMTRTDNGHTRPASCVAFSWAGQVAAGDPEAAPRLLITGGEDRRVLVWGLHNYTQLQDQGLADAPAVGQASEPQAISHVQGSLLRLEIKHGSKVNCVATGRATTKHLVFVGDTRKRLSVYCLPEYV